MVMVKGELYGQAQATTGPHRRMESSDGTGAQLLSTACLTVSCISTSILPPPLQQTGQPSLQSGS